MKQCDISQAITGVSGEIPCMKTVSVVKKQRRLRTIAPYHILSAALAIHFNTHWRQEFWCCHKQDTVQAWSCDHYSTLVWPRGNAGISIYDKNNRIKRNLAHNHYTEKTLMSVFLNMSQFVDLIYFNATIIDCNINQ